MLPAPLTCIVADGSCRVAMQDVILSHSCASPRGAQEVKRLHHDRRRASCCKHGTRVRVWHQYRAPVAVGDPRWHEQSRAALRHKWMAHRVLRPLWAHGREESVPDPFWSVQQMSRSSYRPLSMFLIYYPAWVAVGPIAVLTVTHTSLKRIFTMMQK